MREVFASASTSILAGIAFHQAIRRVAGSDFLPPRFSYPGNSAFIWANLATDVLIALSCAVISITLATLVYKNRGSIPFRWLFLAFGIFIVATGATHVMEVITVWTPAYIMSATVKVIAAVASLAAAVWLPIAVPQIEQLIQQSKACVSSEAQFRDLLNGAPDAMVVVGSNGKIEFANSQVEKLFGWTTAEVVGQTVEFLIPSRFRDRHADHRAEFHNDPHTRPMGIGMELYALRKDEHEFPVEISLSPIETNSGISFTAAIRDVTERKKAEEALRLSEQKFRLIVETANDYAILMLDRDGNVASWNLGAQRIEGYKAEEIIGRHFSCFYPEQDIRSGKPDSKLQVARSTGRAEDEGWRVRKDGSRFWANSILSPLIDPNGRLMGYAKITRDLTIRKQLDDSIRDLNHELELRNADLLSVNKELESFSYSISHDLRAPLRSIDGFSLALLEDCSDNLTAEGKSYLSRIRGATQRMGLLIDEVLNLARTARCEIEVNEIDLSELAQEVIATLRSSDPQRRVNVHISSHLIIRGDRTLMRVVLENLLGNAWKFTSKRDDAVIELGVTTQPPNVDVLFIRDNGVGFDMKYSDKLFGVFQRLHDSREFPGTGVGLATVQRIIRRHGGSIWAQSEVNQGSTFFFAVNGGLVREVSLLGKAARGIQTNGEPNAVAS